MQLKLTLVFDKIGLFRFIFHFFSFLVGVGQSLSSDSEDKMLFLIMKFSCFQYSWKQLDEGSITLKFKMFKLSQYIKNKRPAAPM